MPDVCFYLIYEKMYCGVHQKGVLLVVVQLDRSLVKKKFCRCYIDFIIACHTSERVEILLLYDNNLTTELYLLDKSTTSWIFWHKRIA